MITRKSAVLTAGLAIMAMALVLPGCHHAGSKSAQSAVSAEQQLVDAAARRVKASLVRIRVVEPDYYQGREEKGISFGSGCIISPEGYIITNHHVAGKAVNLVCTMPNREEMSAILIGTDPATDIAIIKLQPSTPTEFPWVPFGNSDDIRVGDPVLALGSPVALSQSVTRGIVSNTEMITPPSFGDSKFELDGENVGELVRWIGHDAAIYPGNSGGPLVNLQGEIVGVNEIGLGLGGAIPGNLAKQVADQIIAEGRVRRAWAGIGIQPLLKNSGQRQGVLINTVFENSPAAEAGLEPGDVLVSVNGTTFEGRFAEDLPGINNLLANLPIGKEATLSVLRGGESLFIELTPREREPGFIPQREIREWGMAARNVTLWAMLGMARKTRDGVVIEAARQGGPLAKARPELLEGDIIIEVDGEKVSNIDDLQRITAAKVGTSTKMVTVLAKVERDSAELLSVVEIGIEGLPSAAREAVKGWLPMETQVVTKELATAVGQPGIQGVRVTRLFTQRPEDFPFQVGDLITHQDGEPIPASRKEDSEVFAQQLRQYRPGTPSEFTVIRGGEKQTIKATIGTTPVRPREMKRYRDLDFEFIVREVAPQDREKRTLEGQKFSVVVDNVSTGGWAFLGGLQIGDALLKIDGKDVTSLADVEKFFAEARAAKSPTVTLFVRREAQNQFVELETSWK